MTLFRMFRLLKTGKSEDGKFLLCRGYINSNHQSDRLFDTESFCGKKRIREAIFFTKADGGQQRAQIDRGSTCAIATVDSRFYCSNQCSVHPECQNRTTSISDSTTNFLT